MSDSLRHHGLQHTRAPCPSPTPRIYSDSYPLTRWCHLTISSSVIPFSSCFQSFPVSVFSDELVLRIKWPKCWSFSFNISPSNEYSGLISFRMDWLDLLALQGTEAEQKRVIGQRGPISYLDPSTGVFGYSNTLATWCEELTHWKRPWCWERLKAGGEGDDRGWHG